jgi:ATP-binding cassette subfamily C (CFTR/MRP) protein 10
MVQAVLNTQYSFRQGALACRLRSALTCLVYDKTLLVSSVDMAAHSSGAVQTLMSVDADRVVNLFSSLHELWSLPLQIAVALCLLYTQVTLAVHASLQEIPAPHYSPHTIEN